MIKTNFFKAALAIACITTFTGLASADTKVKSRQTSGGQTYENTSYIKGKRQRSEMSNGQMIVVQQCDLRRNIQIMPQAKAYIIQPYGDTANINQHHRSRDSRHDDARRCCNLDRYDERHRRAQTDVWLHRAPHHHDDGN